MYRAAHVTYKPLTEKNNELTGESENHK